MCCNWSDFVGEARYLSSAEARWRSRVRRSSSTLSARACALASASFTLFPSPSLALAAAFSSAAACEKEAVKGHTNKHEWMDPGWMDEQMNECLSE